MRRSLLHDERIDITHRALLLIDGSHNELMYSFLFMHSVIVKI